MSLHKKEQEKASYGIDQIISEAEHWTLLINKKIFLPVYIFIASDIVKFAPPGTL